MRKLRKPTKIRCTCGALGTMRRSHNPVTGEKRTRISCSCGNDTGFMPGTRTQAKRAFAQVPA